MGKKEDYEVAEEVLPEDVVEGDFFIPEERAPTPPGEMIKKEFLEPLDMTQRELAEHMGVHLPRVNELLTGKRGITVETAAMLAKVFDTSERFWINLQAAHDLYKLRNSSNWEKIEKAEKAVQMNRPQLVKLLRKHGAERSTVPQNNQ